MDDRLRIDFLDRTYGNAQGLIRFMDQKVASLVAVVGIVTTILAAGMLSVLQRPGDTPPWLLRLAALFGIAYILLSLAIAWEASRAYAAQGRTRGAGTAGGSLLFPLGVLEGYPTVAAYAQRVREVGVDDLIGEYAHQIHAVSTIYQDKQARVNRLVGFFRVLLFLWVADAVLLVFVLGSR